MGNRSVKIFSIISLAICVLLLLLVLFGCNTPKIITSTDQSKIKTDSIHQSVNTDKNIFDSTHEKAAATGEIDFNINCDSNGNAAAVDIAIKQGESGMSIKTTGHNTYKAKYNCEKEVNRWRTEVIKRDSLLSHKSDSIIYKTQLVTKEITVYRTPWYNEVLFIVLGLIILILLIYIFIQKINFFKTIKP